MVLAFAGVEPLLHWVRDEMDVMDGRDSGGRQWRRSAGTLQRKGKPTVYPAKSGQIC